MAREQERAGIQHPEEWRYDLNPSAAGGPDADLAAGDDLKNAPVALDFKELHGGTLAGFSDADLRQIVVLPPGARLREGATYLDLNDPARRELTATEHDHVPHGTYYVPKSALDYQLWNRLIGVRDPARLDQETRR